MKDKNGRSIRAGNTIRVTERRIDSLVDAGTYKVTVDKDGNLIILPGVSISELPSNIVLIVR